MTGNSVDRVVSAEKLPCVGLQLNASKLEALLDEWAASCANGNNNLRVGSRRRVAAKSSADDFARTGYCKDSSNIRYEVLRFSPDS